MSYFIATSVLFGWYGMLVHKFPWFMVFSPKRKVMETKLHFGVSYVTYIIMAPVFITILIIFIFPFVKDTALVLMQRDTLQEKKITVWENSTAVGMAFIGQDIKTEEDEDFSLPLSFQQLRGAEREYIIRYLPHSNFILEFRVPERTEGEIRVIIPFKQIPNREAAAELEQSLTAALQQTGAGYLVKSIQPMFDESFYYDSDRSIYTYYGFKATHSSVLSIRGDSAETIYRTILPILSWYPFLVGSSVEIRYKDRTKEDKFGFSAITLE